MCGEACSLQPFGDSLCDHFHENTGIWRESTQPNLTAVSTVSLDVVVYIAGRQESKWAGIAGRQQCRENAHSNSGNISRGER